MEKIAIIEDDLSIREELCLLVCKNGYQGIYPTDLKNVEEFIQKEGPDLILLDINLPYQNGFEICKKIRSFYHYPIIFVTSRDTEEDELKSMMIGGDDFITKPYNTSILLARIKAILKRSNPLFHSEIERKGVKLNIHLSFIEYDKKQMDLTKNEFRILYYLFTHPSKIVSKDELIEYMWNNKLYVDENILNVNIARLRKKMDEMGLVGFIETIRGQGFRI